MEEKITCHSEDLINLREEEYIYINQTAPAGGGW